MNGSKNRSASFIVHHSSFIVMRWYILRTLLHKEVLRHLANRGGLALAALLVVASMLLTLFGQDEGQPTNFAGGLQHCFVDYWEDGPWIEHLRQSVPAVLRPHIRFRAIAQVLTLDQTLFYPAASGAIQIRSLDRDQDGPHYKIWIWHPGKDGSALAPYEAWFWKETHAFFQEQVASAVAKMDPKAAAAVPLPILEEERSALRGGLDARSGIETALVLFALFFVCVYLLPSLTCEERERGVLLAQALSPASPREILAAKFLFYPAAGMALAALLAGVNQPAVLRQPFFWLALMVAACGFLGIGLTIASLARTQRAASMGAMCYMMVVGLLLFICQHGNIPGLPYLALEYHCPRMLHACLSGAIVWYHWGQLAVAAVLAALWAVLATVLFRRYGWQ
jgi:hypothetical protein